MSAGGLGEYEIPRVLLRERSADPDHSPCYDWACMCALVGRKSKKAIQPVVDTCSIALGLNGLFDDGGYGAFYSCMFDYCALKRKGAIDGLASYIEAELETQASKFPLGLATPMGDAFTTVSVGSGTTVCPEGSGENDAYNRGNGMTLDAYIDPPFSTEMSTWGKCAFCTPEYSRGQADIEAGIDTCQRCPTAETTFGLCADLIKATSSIEQGRAAEATLHSFGKCECIGGPGPTCDGLEWTQSDDGVNGAHCGVCAHSGFWLRVFGADSGDVTEHGADQGGGNYANMPAKYKQASGPPLINSWPS